MQHGVRVDVAPYPTGANHRPLMSLGVSTQKLSPKKKISETFTMIFCCTMFTTDGAQWCVKIKASSWEDAEATALNMSLRLDGEWVADIEWDGV